MKHKISITVNREHINDFCKCTNTSPEHYHTRGICLPGKPIFRGSFDDGNIVVCELVAKKNQMINSNRNVLSFRHTDKENNIYTWEQDIITTRHFLESLSTINYTVGRRSYSIEMKIEDDEDDNLPEHLNQIDTSVSLGSLLEHHNCNRGVPKVLFASAIIPEEKLEEFCKKLEDVNTKPETIDLISTCYENETYFKCSIVIESNKRVLQYEYERMGDDDPFGLFVYESKIENKKDFCKQLSEISFEVGLLSYKLMVLVNTHGKLVPLFKLLNQNSISTKIKKTFNHLLLCSTVIALTTKHIVPYLTDNTMSKLWKYAALAFATALLISLIMTICVRISDAKRKRKISIDIMPPIGGKLSRFLFRTFIIPVSLYICSTIAVSLFPSTSMYLIYQITMYVCVIWGVFWIFSVVARKKR